MKKRITAVAAALFMSAGFVFAATNDITGLLQKGLFEEEANHNLEAAMRQYQAAIDGFDTDRQLAATAVFRLGECLRKAGKTNEADVQYERILRDFPDQATLAGLSREYLAGKTPPVIAAGSLGTIATTAEDEEVRKIREMIRNSPDLINVTIKESGYTPLQQSVEDGNVAAAELLLANGANLNGTGRKGMTPLGLAAESGNKAMIELLLAHDADVNATQPLYYAVTKGFKTAAEVLIAHKADVNARRSDGATPLQAAARAGFKAMAEILIAHGAEVNAADNDGNTPLFSAIQKNDAELVELLLAGKAEVNCTNSAGETPLFLAAQDDQIKGAQLLLAAKANVNARDKSGYTPLHRAVLNNQTGLVKLFLSNKADVNAATDIGITPLLFAAARAGVNKQGNYGYGPDNLPLGSAAANLVKILLENGADPQAHIKEGGGAWGPIVPGIHALDLAIQYDRTDEIELLLPAKAEVNYTNSAGATPLFMAARDDQIKTAQLLLAAKANVNAKAESGYTPLHRAVLNNQIGLVKLFLSNNANVNATTDIGITPLLFAVARSDVNIGGQIQGSSENIQGIRVPYRGNPGMPGMAMSYRTPGGIGRSDSALGDGATNLVKFLLENGADPQAHIKEGGGSWGPIVPGIHALDLAIAFGRTEEMELLLASHADPNARFASSQYSGTPLLWVLPLWRNDPAKIAEELKFLLEHGADPDLTDQEGRTPLSRAAEHGDLHSVQQLLDHQADPNKPDNQGYPPLAYVGNNVEIKAALLKAGANEDFQRLGRIFIAQKGTGTLGNEIFRKGTNSVNHFTLLETLAQACKDGRSPVDFPDFAHVVINRLKPGGGKEDIAVNLEDILTSGDSSKDVPLEWGDVVQIPQLDQLLNESPGMLPDKDRDGLIKCLQRHVQILVKEQTTKLTLVPPINKFQPYTVMNLDVMLGFPGAVTAQDVAVKKTIETFSLDEVVHQANVLLLSSDLTRVKVTRNGQEMQYNLAPPPPENNNPNRLPGRAMPNPVGLRTPAPPAPGDLWLRDGDLIEIPERDPNAPAMK